MTAAFFGPVLTFRRTFFFGDIINAVERLAFTGRWLKMGRFPLWNPLLSLGASQAADQTPFYLPHLLLTLALGDRFYDLDAALHMFWAASGMFVLARTLGRSRAAALLCAIPYAFGGFAFGHLQHLSILVAMAWIPWVLATTERYMARRDRRSLAFGMLTVGLLALGGHPQLTVYGFCAQAAYCVFRLAKLAIEGQARAVLPLVAGLVALDLVGFAVAAAYLLPFAEWMRFISRADSVTADYATWYSLPRTRLVTLVDPLWYGGSPDRPHGAGSLVEYSSYVGLLPLALAVVAVARPTAQALGLLLGGLAALVLAMGNGTPVYQIVLALPLLSWVRAPARFMVLADLSIALLAAFGLDALRAGNRPRLPRALAVGASSMAVLVGRAAWLAQRSTLGLPGRPDALRFQQPDTLVLLLALVGAAALLWALSGRRGIRPGLLALTLVFVTTDVWAFRSRLFFYAGVPATAWSEPSSTADAILRGGGSPRFYTQVGKEVASSVLDAQDFDGYRRQMWESLSASLPMRQGLQSASGHLMEPPAYAHLLSLVKGVLDSRAARVAGTLGVRWIIASPRRRIAAPELTLVADGVFDLYRNKAALPRVYLARESRVVTDPALAFELLEDPGFQPTDTVLLDAPGPALPRGPLVEALATIVHDEPDRVVVGTLSSRPAWLVLNDTFAPGWTAFVDGSRQPIWRANALVRAVIVPAGKHHVAFVYTPLSVRLGAVISGVALVAVAMLFSRPGGWSAHVGGTARR